MSENDPNKEMSIIFLSQPEILWHRTLKKKKKTKKKFKNLETTRREKVMKLKPREPAEKVL